MATLYLFTTMTKMATSGLVRHVLTDETTTIDKDAGTLYIRLNKKERMATMYEKRKYYTASISEEDYVKVSQWAEVYGYNVARAIRMGLKLFIEKYVDGEEVAPLEIINPGNKFEVKLKDEHGRIIKEE